MKKSTTVTLRPRTYSKLTKFAARKKVDLNLLMDVIVQDFLDTWDKKFTAEERRRWHEQAEKLNWPEDAIAASRG